MTFAEAIAWAQANLSLWMAAPVLAVTHAALYLRDAKADMGRLARLLVKGATMTTATTSPVIIALEQDLPELIRGTKAIAKTLLDTVYTTGTPDEKAAKLTADLEPKFNAALEAKGLPAWALGMIDGVFGTIVKGAVEAIEVADPSAAGA